MAPAQTRQRNPRGRGGDLRLEIIGAATRLIDRGTDRLTLRAIAREAGVAGPSLYDHFAGLESITNAVIRTGYEDLIARIHGALDGVADPVERLEAICFAYAAYGAEFPYRYDLVFRSERDEAERVAVSDRGADALATLVDGITACRAAGRSGSDDPSADAVIVWAAIHGLTTLRAIRPNFERLHADAMMRSSVHRLARITDA